MSVFVSFLAQTLVIPFLILIMPGGIAASVRHKRLIRFTRDNWRLAARECVLFSLIIIVAVNIAMYVIFPRRIISFVPWTDWGVGDFAQYVLFTVLAAAILPKLWDAQRLRHGIFHIWQKLKTDKIREDE